MNSINPFSSGPREADPRRIPNATITDDERIQALEGLRVPNNRWMPHVSGFVVSFSLDLASAATPDRAGRLSGHTYEAWQFQNSRFAYGACVYGPGHAVVMLVLAERSPRGHTLTTFTPSGANASGDVAGLADVNQWFGYTLEMATNSVWAALSASRATVDRRQTRHSARSFRPLIDFAATGQPTPVVESWSVLSRTTYTVDRTPILIEIWNKTEAPIGTTSDLYRTPHIAVAYNSAGTILAMAAIEQMPSAHSDTFLIGFMEGLRHNLGRHPDLLDLKKFTESATDWLLNHVSAPEKIPSPPPPVRHLTPEPGKDALARISMSLDDCAFGVRRDLTVETAIRCNSCAGLGFGADVNSDCLTCGGSGRVRSRRTISYNIPPGVRNGMRIRLAGQGEVGIRGGAQGDLYLEVDEQPHPVFHRDVDDLHLHIRASRAQLGRKRKLDVDTLLDGHTTIHIGANKDSEIVVPLAGYGMPTVNSSHRGDFYVHVHLT